MVNARNCMAVERERERERESYTLVNKGCSLFAKPKDSLKAC